MFKERKITEDLQVNRLKKKEIKCLFVTNLMVIRNKNLKKVWTALKLKPHLWLIYFLLLDLEGSAAEVPTYMEQNNILFVKHFYHSENGRHKHMETKVACCSQRKTFPSFRKVH